MIQILGKLCDRISTSCQKRRDTDAAYAAEQLRLAVKDYNEAVDLCEAAGLSVDVDAIRTGKHVIWIFDRKLKIASLRKTVVKEF